MAENKECANCTDDSCSAREKRSDEKMSDYEERQQLARRMCQIKHKIIVLSGKGGVGKSTVAVNLAVSLSVQGNRVGLLDVDIHGPSIPRLLNLEDRQIESSGNALVPVKFSETLKVISIGFMLKDRNDAIIWRGPMKYGVIRQFLKDVEWGELDYLVIDSPPGTGDEPLALCQMIEYPEGAVIVTTPAELSLLDVRKSITFCRQLNMPVLGMIENMSGFSCPKCGEIVQIFPQGGARDVAAEMGVPFLGQIPVDPALASACDEGKPYVTQYAHSLTTGVFMSAIESILNGKSRSEEVAGEVASNNKTKETDMRIAIPTAEGKLAMHFGHCDAFTIIDVNRETKQVLNSEALTPPAHEPGVLPKWLGEMNVNVIISGGMGSRAQNLFAEQGIEVVVGASQDTPEKLVDAYLCGTLQSGENVCDH